MSLPPEPPLASPASPEGPLAPGSGLPVNVAAGLASLFTLPSGIFFFFLDRKEAFVRHYSIQGMVIGGLGTLMYIVHGLFVFILGSLAIFGRLLLPVFNFVTALISLVFLVVWVISTICAFSGKLWQIPYLSSVLKGRISRLP